MNAEELDTWVLEYQPTESSVCFCGSADTSPHRNESYSLRIVVAIDEERCEFTCRPATSSSVPDNERRHRFVDTDRLNQEDLRKLWSLCVERGNQES